MSQFYHTKNYIVETSSNKFKRKNTGEKLPCDPEVKYIYSQLDKLRNTRLDQCICVTKIATTGQAWLGLQARNQEEHPGGEEEVDLGEESV